MANGTKWGGEKTIQEQRFRLTVYPLHCCSSPCGTRINPVWIRRPIKQGRRVAIESTFPVSRVVNDPLMHSERLSICIGEHYIFNGPITHEFRGYKQVLQCYTADVVSDETALLPFELATNVFKVPFTVRAHNPGCPVRSMHSADTDVFKFC